MRLKYPNVEIYTTVYPKYGKLSFRITRDGDLGLTAAPSFTPGKLPEGIKAGKIPKGLKLIDYSKEVMTSFSFGECLSIIRFFEKRNPEDEVSIIRKTDFFDKSISIRWNKDDNTGRISYVTIFFSYKEIKSRNGEALKESKFHLVFSIANLGELVEVIRSYVNSFAAIVLTCRLDKESSPDQHDYRKNISIGGTQVISPFKPKDPSEEED